MAITNTVSPENEPKSPTPAPLTSAEKKAAQDRLDGIDVTKATSLGEIMEIAKVMAASGQFPDVKNAQDATARMVLGRFFGLDPMQALMNLFFINGRPGMQYPALLAKIRQHPDYKYKILETSPKKATIAIYDRHTGEEIGQSSFTAEQAAKAGTKNMDKWAENMLIARATANAVRWFCPDVVHGVSVYVPGEIPEDGTTVGMGNAKDRLRADLIAKTAQEDPSKADAILAEHRDVPEEETDGEEVPFVPDALVMDFGLTAKESQQFETSCKIGKFDKEKVMREAWEAGIRDFAGLFDKVDPNKGKS